MLNNGDTVLFQETLTCQLLLVLFCSCCSVGKLIQLEVDRRDDVYVLVAVVIL